MLLTSMFSRPHQYGFSRLKLRIDGNHGRNTGYFQYILYFGDWTDDGHFPAAVGNRFGIYGEESNTDGRQEINFSEIYDDKRLFTRTIAVKSGLNLASSKNIQAADQFEHADASRRLVELKFHCSHLFQRVLTIIWKSRRTDVNNMLWLIKPYRFTLEPHSWSF